MKKLISIMGAVSLVAGISAAPRKAPPKPAAPAVAAPTVAPAAAPAAAASGGGKVNASDIGVQLKGYAGFGPTIAYMEVGSSSSLPTSGLSAGNGFAAGVNPMLSWKFLAIEPAFNFYNFSKVAQSSGNVDGSGSVITVDATGGLKLFTERDDMGYTYFYGGFRYWTSSSTVTGTAISINGAGWVAGFRDYSTFRVSGPYAIGLTTGVWVTSAPATSFTQAGTSRSMTSPTGLGIGYELMLGLAIEDMGLAIDAGLRTDVLATAGTITSTSYGLFAFGAQAYVLQVNYVLQ